MKHTITKTKYLTRKRIRPSDRKWTKPPMVHKTKKDYSRQNNRRIEESEY